MAALTVDNLMFSDGSVSSTAGTGGVPPAPPTASIPIFTGASTLGNSLITQTSQNIVVDSSRNVQTTTLQLVGDSSMTSADRFVTGSFSPTFVAYVNPNVPIVTTYSKCFYTKIIGNFTDPDDNDSPSDIVILTGCASSNTTTDSGWVFENILAFPSAIVPRLYLDAPNTPMAVSISVSGPKIIQSINALFKFAPGPPETFPGWSTTATGASLGVITAQYTVVYFVAKGLV